MSQRVPLGVLNTELTRLFVRHGLAEHDAAVVAEVLTEAEAEGLTGHGLGRVPIYVKQLSAGGLNPTPSLSVTRASPGVVHVAADRAMGAVAGVRAVTEVAPVAREVGVAVVAVRQAGHVGPLSAYVSRLARQGLVGFATANTPPALAPWGGNRAVLGTNPIAFAAPLEPTPLVIDLALSTVARGKILEAARQGDALAEGWALDAAGEPTTDAARALEGTLTPLGGAKGYALAVMVEVLAGVLAGQVLSQDLSLPWQAPASTSHPGFMLLALEPTAFGAEGAFQTQMQALAGVLQDAGGRLPGVRRAQTRARAVREGVQVGAALAQTLRDLGVAGV